MIKGLFEVAVDTPKRRYHGAVKAQSSGDTVTLLADIVDVGELEIVAACEGNDFRFEGEVPVGETGVVISAATGRVWGASFDATLQTTMGKVEIFGTHM